MSRWPQLADPIRNSDIDATDVVWWYYAAVVVFGGLLGLNLFVAVVSFAFNEAQSQMETAEGPQEKSDSTEMDEKEMENPFKDGETFDGETFESGSKSSPESIAAARAQKAQL